VSLPWSIHLPTADATCVRLRLRPRDEGAPWPFTLALTELGRLGAVAAERFRSLGRGRGEPLLASQELLWRGCPVHLETAAGEASLALPAWDRMAETEANEDGFWELVDTFAAAVGARHGAIGDGEALAPPGAAWQGAIERHLALLLPPAVAGDLGTWRVDRYRELPLSGLAVLLR